MGLEQYIRAGAKLERGEVTLTTQENGSGSVDLGSSYTLLSISTTAPCRLRLYDNSQSLANGGERIRAFGNTSISASVALVGDFSMSAAGTYTVDPAIYGITLNTVDKLSYYRVENTQSGQYPVINFTRYLMEVPSVSTANRVTIPEIKTLLAPGQLVSGTLSSTTVPRTYLLVSASVQQSTAIARLRLYSTTDSFSNSVEISRSFATESSNNSKLIVDAIISGSELTYFVPKIAGANLQTMGTDLNTIRADRTAIMGLNELYYVIQNMSSSGGTVPFTASLHVFALED
jgi:hypothetical protein